MIDQELQTNLEKEPLYRGVLVYRNEYGYRLLTLMVDLYTPDEQSCVTSSLGEVELVEEVDCLPSCLPLAGIDIYHFAVVEGTEITLTITDHAEEHQARYTIHANGVEEHPSSFRLHVTNVCKNGRTAFIQW